MPTKTLPSLSVPDKRWSVRTFLIWLVLACLIPGVIGAVALFVYQYREGRAQQERNTIQTARALVQAIDSQLDKSRVVAQALSTEDSLLRHDHARFHKAAREVLALSGTGANVVLHDSAGQQLVNTAIEFGQPLPRQQVSQQVRRAFDAGKPTFSDLFIGVPLERPIMSVNVPVMIDGLPAYVLGVGILPAQFNAVLKAQNLPPGWVAAVFDSSGTIVGRSRAPEQFVGNKVTAPLFQAILKTSEGSIESTTQEGFAVVSAYSRSSVTNWGVAIGIPRQSLVDALLERLAILAAGVAALFGIGLVLAWFMGGRIAYSVRALMKPAIALGRGESPNVPELHFREAAEVGSAIDRAANLLHERSAALKARETELAQAHAYLRNVIDSSPALIYLKDLDGNLLLVNRMYEQLIGAPASAPGADDARRQTMIPTAAPVQAGAGSMGTIDSADIKVMEGAGVVQFDEDIDTVDGVRHFAVSKGPLRDPAGRVIGICAAAVDITSLKVAEAKVRVLVETLERRVEQRTGELNLANARLVETNARLQDANGQLEAFSYTVAHDLRAPLRGIQGFAEAVREDFEDKLDDTGRDYLQRISRAAERMERLIDDLLSFSRLSRMELGLGTVSLDDVFAEVLTNLASQIQASGARVMLVPDLPHVRANKSACLHIFQNLVSNAIKFARPDTPQVIRIWTEAPNTEQSPTPLVRICIEDNGIGIPAAQRERIFKPFERLHGIDEYAGTGIGLAVVDTAVRRMHGRCGVESEVGAGSCFWVELPAVHAED